MNCKRTLKTLFVLLIMAVMAGCGPWEGEDRPYASATPQATSTPTGTPSNTPTNTATPTNTFTPTPSPTTAITIGMVGDVLLHTRIETDCRQDDGSYDYNSIFKNTKDIISAFDLALVNQEVIIGGAELGISAYPTFNADFSLAEALVNAGFDVALHATNHALDKRKAGVINCLNNWKKYPSMTVMGIFGSKEEADSGQIYYYTKDDVTIAFLNFTYGTNGIPIPNDMPYCVGPLLTDENKEQIGLLLDEAGEKADFVVVCPHWGTEYTLKETTTQKKWNTFFYQHGVNLVIGTHPHVIEPIAVTDSSGTKNLTEYLEDENGHRTIAADAMLTFYSIGNYVNWTSESGAEKYQRMLGGLAGITVSKNEEGKAFILDFDITPLVSHVVTGKNQVTVYRLEDYTKELAELNEMKKQSSNFSLDNLISLADKVFGKLWKKQ